MRSIQKEQKNKFLPTYWLLKKSLLWRKVFGSKKTDESVYSVTKENMIKISYSNFSETFAENHDR